jgi:hypothetical protein
MINAKAGEAEGVVNCRTARRRYRLFERQKQKKHADADMSRQLIRELVFEQYKKGVVYSTEAARNIEKTVGVKVNEWTARKYYGDFRRAAALESGSPPKTGRCLKQ